MGSNYFGEPNYMMTERGGFLSSSTASTSSSSRKGKKNGSEKPKQPQRGLGVAQLEKIRIHSQLGSCGYLPSHHHAANNPYEAHMRLDTPHSSSPSYSGFHGHMMGYADHLDRANAAYGDSQSSSISRWHQGNAGFGSTQHYFVEPSMSTRSFFDQGSLNNRRELMDLMGSSVHNSEPQDVDLELRL